MCGCVCVCVYVCVCLCSVMLKNVIVALPELRTTAIQKHMIVIFIEKMYT